jgi:hypothetical protein
VLTNMRGLFSDVVADQVMGYATCFARNPYVYVLQSAAGRRAHAMIGQVTDTGT